MKRSALWVLSGVLILSFLLMSCTSQTSNTNPTPSPTAKPQLTSEDLLGAYSDGAYDYSFAPLELRGFSEDEFDPWIRPVIPALFTNEGNNIAGTFQVRAMGIMCGRYVIAGSGPFQVATVPDEKTQHLGGVIVWDVIETAEGNQLVTEKVKLLKQIFAPEFEVGIVVLERSLTSEHPMPPENTCLFPIGDGTQLNALHALLLVGQIKGEDAALTLPWRPGHATYVNQENGQIELFASTWVHDWGSPIFALRDGTPELVGMATGGWNGYMDQETRSFGLTIEMIFQLIRQELGIVFKTLPPESAVRTDTPPSLTDGALRARLAARELLDEAKSPYAKTLQHFDLAGSNPETAIFTDCVQKVSVITNDDQGNYFARRDGRGFVHGEYLFVPTSLFPALPPPTIPPPLQDPNFPPEERDQFLEEFQRELDRLQKFTHEVMILWPPDGPAWFIEFTKPVEIKDTDLSFELQTLGVHVFKRVPTFDGTGKQREYPSCNHETVAKLKDFEAGTMLVGPQFSIGKKEGVLALEIGKNVFQAEQPSSNSFLLQGSTVWEDLGMPLFVLNVRSGEWELAGLTIHTYSPFETRARAVAFERLLDILAAIEADTDESQEGGGE